MTPKLGRSKRGSNGAQPDGLHKPTTHLYYATDDLVHSFIHRKQREVMKGSRDWAIMLPELLETIVESIPGYKDFFAFGSACKTWHLATTFVNYVEPPLEFPLLMLSDGTKHEEVLTQTINNRSIFDIFSSSTFDINVPEAYGKKCFGVNFGWIFTLSSNQKIKLLHPFSRRQIDLSDCESLISHYLEVNPPHPAVDEDFHQHLFLSFIRKVHITCSPNDDDNCIVFIIFAYYRAVAFTRVGDKSWKIIKSPLPGFEDIIYYKGLLYAINKDGIVFKCDIEDEYPQAVAITLPVDSHHWDLKYLVELDGDIFAVLHIFGGVLLGDDEDIDDFDERYDDETLDYFTRDFKIFKMERVVGSETSQLPYRWVEINTIGNRALFLGDNSSVSLSSNQCNMIKSNCIYYTDDNLELTSSIWGRGYNMGIFNIQERSIQRHYSGPSRSNHCPPLWYI